MTAGVHINTFKLSKSVSFFVEEGVPKNGQEEPLKFSNISLHREYAVAL